MAEGTTVSDEASLAGVSYLFGFPITHSMSPLLHDTVYKTLGLSRAQIPLSSQDINDLLRRLQDPKFYGASVTMPHKINIIPHLDILTEEARDVGACNTIFVQQVNGKRVLCGTNTDVVGIREAFARNVEDISAITDRPGLVIGGGGAARSAVYALQRWLGCDDVYLVNRDPAEVAALVDQHARSGGRGKLIHVENVEQAENLQAPGPVVSCIPDFAPITPAEVEVRDVIQCFLSKPQKGVVLEMCYHPSPWTRIADSSKRAGCQVILGTEAMIWQGLEQDRYWTGLSLDELPVEEVKCAIDKALAKALL